MMKKFYYENKRNPWCWAFFALIVVALIAIPLMSRDAGNSGDEDGFQIPQGRNVANYYKTGGKDTTCMAFENLKYYGSSPDVIAEFWNQTFKVENINLSRHIFNAFYGWIALLFAGLIACLIGGWRAGVYTVLLLFFSPRFLGHSFNNPKDIPFAAAVVASIYFMVLFFKQFPKVKISTILFLILFIAFSISVRIGGVLLYAYFGMFGFAFIVKEFITRKVQKAEKQKSRKAEKSYSPTLLLSYGLLARVGKLFLYGLGIAIVSYFLGLLLWPYALQAPFKHPLEAFSEMSKFAVGIRQLFEGSLQWSDILPWYYTPKFILMTIPVAVILGLILFLIFIWKDKKNYFNYFIIFFTFFFPIFWIVYTNANVYGGWRHTLFAYPTMVAAAGLGFSFAVEWISKKVVRKAKNPEILDSSENIILKNNNLYRINIVAIIVLLLLLWNPIRHIIKNHPYQYVYFNELAGGIGKVYGNYETDYYYHSTREAAEWILKNNKLISENEKIKVASWHLASVQYFFRNDTADYSVGFSRWYERGNSDWDYAIFTVTGMMPEELKHENFPPTNTVYQVTVDNKPICLVLKRETKEDLIGFQLKNSKEYELAIIHLTKALEKDPMNVSIFVNLIESYFNSGKVDSAKIYIEQLLDFVPKYEPANYMLAHYYYYTSEPDKALQILKTIRENNFQFKAAYHFAFQICAQRNDLKNAEKLMLELLAIEQLDEQGFNQLISVYKAQGLDERAAYKKIYKKYADMYQKKGKKKEAKMYQDALKKI
jgi:tetratricopeptide (TPR) repeat protein